jgi:4-carboxymuconolactone decarboxylase
MSDPNPFEAMMKMGQDWAKQMEGLMPTMPAEAMENAFGKGMNPDGLDVKARLLMTLMGLTITGAQAEAQIKLTVRHLVEAEATEQEIAETIALAAMFGGGTGMAKAMELAKDVLDKDETS